MYLAELGKIMYQHKVGLLPNIFNNTFTLGYQTHGYNTRNGSSFHVPKCRINMSFFLPVPGSFAQTFKIQVLQVLQLLKTS